MGMFVPLSPGTLVVQQTKHLTKHNNSIEKSEFSLEIKEIQEFFQIET